MDLESIFTPDEKAALNLLCKRGFKVYTEVKVEDVKELDGVRHRTFRNQGRYDLALMLKSAQFSVAKAVEEVEAPPVVVEVEPEPVVAVASEPVIESADVTVETEAKVEAAESPAEKPKKKTSGRKKKTVKRTYKPR